jgi:two-component system, sensor histidine kinase and response regulator
VQSRWHDGVRPAQAIGFALLISFAVYFAFDIGEQFLAPYSVPEYTRLAHFVYGFLACASGMTLVWFAMSRQNSALTQEKAIRQALLDERADFLAVINHRLRNPLIASDRIVKLFLNGDFGNLTAEQRTILQHVSENNNEVDRLVRTLADIYKYRTGGKDLVFETHHVSTLVSDAIAELGSAAAERSVSVENFLPDTWTIDCDAAELRRCILHLLENGIKHARTKVAITGMNNGETLHISIDDDGVGISENDVSQLFNRFFVSSYGGKYAAFTGIGLCLCAEIAKAHGGSLTCRSQFGVGTTFELTLAMAMPVLYTNPRRIA